MFVIIQTRFSIFSKNKFNSSESTEFNTIFSIINILFLLFSNFLSKKYIPNKYVDLC